jgi:multiple sugar transport system substrate-binding protein
MAKKRRGGISRREFVKLVGTGALAAGVGPAFLFPERAQAQQKTLKILQWSHFVPAYDTWFNGKFTKEWGQKNNTNVVVDNINLVDLGTRAASEVSAQ